MTERNGEWEQDSRNGGGGQYFSEHIFFSIVLLKPVMISYTKINN